MRIPGRALPAATSLVSRAAINNPTVDLGYEVHTSMYNETGDYYAFTNIRYADPPERFSKAVAPTTTSGAVINDTSTRFCPQAYPWWLVLQVATENGLGDNPNYFEDNYLYAVEGNEDCLFLDVYSPSSIFNGTSSDSDGAAVVVWIHGGGYTIGSKTDADWNPAGLILESEVEDQDGIVFVKLNYRLGMFGWMGYGDGVIDNLGAWDQRLALEWVQEYIHLFGGDPNRVTVMGESAGGGSIMLQMTAFGGSQGPAPFQQAIVQSPGFEATPNASIGWNHALEAAANLTGTTVTTLEQLRALDSATAIEVNKDAVNISSHGLWTYGPVSGSDFTPDMPAFLLASGQFDDTVTVMVGHNIDEAEEFAPNDAYTNADVKEWAYKLLTNVSDTAIDDILTNVYPDDLSGDYGYTTEADRLELMMADSAFTCNTRYLAKAYVGAGQDFFGYEFAYAPGVHAQDTAFTFYNGDETDTATAGTIVDPVLATTMQKYFTRFAQTGNPNGLTDLVEWPEYNSGESDITNTLLRFNTEIDTIEDPTANARCEYWQSGAWRE